MRETELRTPFLVYLPSSFIVSVRVCTLYAFVAECVGLNSTVATAAIKCQL